ncbi:MAG: hypothetical protein A2Z99_21645 [Treponema sp. GWB1_62_6]|nr:MAG: hypothetical protein A2Y36_10280 [Treponema sp. GWA1_62_8]OHE64725.1 MAG: hypothetical protein A2001_04205 [Treponema sp. GWC1_61_84]OHE67749.1 MAG: hypothetical protein A2Z99_21645 [Treponema sp. GWB1_62_6]OHE75632.1 MAG: hypothetical protein A2413_11200 [Treponema sp. RIFOXYC1_FULL_61_9]HCM27562.1 hypothetical protein [Treponema sp.]
MMGNTDRQKEIVDAALSLISGKGIQELTMKRLAEAVGVSEPAIYRHFASKSEILAAVVDDVAASRSASLGEAHSSGLGPEETLVSFFRSHALLFMRRPALTAVLFSEDVFRSDPALMSRVGAIMEDTLATIRAEIAKGKRLGRFRGELDEVNGAFMLAGGFRLLVSTWQLGNETFNLPERTDAYVRSALMLIEK